MPDRLQVPVDIKAFLHLRDGEIPPAVYEGLQSLDGPIAVGDTGKDLHPVAGGQVQGLTDLRKTHQFGERLISLAAE